MRQFTGFSLAQVTVGAALVATAQFLKKNVEQIVQYGVHIRALSTLIGSNTEQTQMLIQAADDMGISYEAMSTAMEAAIRKGVSPSIEGLGRLADQYNAIQDPIAKSKFLMDTFGRSGSDMARLMELGAQGIQLAGQEAKNLGLVLSTETLQAAEANRVATDQLGDAMNALGMTIGQKAIPALTWLEQGLTNAATAAQLLITAQERLKNAQIEAETANQNTTQSYAEYLDAQLNLNAANQLMGMTVEDVTRYFREHGTVTREMADLYGLLTLAEWQNTDATKAANWEMYNGTNAAYALGQAISNIPNKTVHIDVITRYYVYGKYGAGGSSAANNPYDYISSNETNEDYWFGNGKGGGGGYGGGGGGMSQIDTSAREAEQALQRQIQAQQSKLSSLITGQLGNQSSTYAEKIAGLVEQQADFMKQIEEYQSYGFMTTRQKDELALLKEKYDAITESIQKQATEHDKATKSIMFNLLQQQLGLDGMTMRESDLLMGLAQRWGLIDQATADAWKQFEQYSSQINNSGMDIGSLIDLIAGGMGGTTNSSTLNMNVASSLDLEALVQEVLKRIKQGY